MTYASVVGRETVRITFLIASLNDLKILAGNIQHTYLNAHTKEKIYFYAGDCGISQILVKFLFKLK